MIRASLPKNQQTLGFSPCQSAPNELRGVYIKVQRRLELSLSQAAVTQYQKEARLDERYDSDESDESDERDES